jgi:hypothetical protein
MAIPDFQTLMLPLGVMAALLRRQAVRLVGAVMKELTELLRKTA